MDSSFLRASGLLKIIARSFCRSRVRFASNMSVPNVGNDFAPGLVLGLALLLEPNCRR